MKLQGPRVVVRPMVQGDLNAMLSWRPIVDPLYQPYDFPHRNQAEQLRWFEWRSKDPARLLYAIENENQQVIGSLTLREIDGHRSARLGITIGADFVSQGYGSEALCLFLDYYFETMGFARMVLDVAATNLRAVRTYRSLGFRYTGHHYQVTSHPSYDILRQEPRYHHLQRFFRRRGVMYELLFYDMALSREEWRTKTPKKCEPSP